ncbi:Myb-like, SWIRM and MPN domains 1 [Linnemannia schmuckeri]|uniref:Myb-like, SWIRM and MPN domains 1 n=1 Tax=Linnemannia schmuckeri TaxID=64567 RepID=A0A9P5S679_9FUNG|nr:Myb-like, SWIRM and MPN domains 1 [Linnemannia schmuckeri]
MAEEDIDIDIDIDGDEPDDQLKTASSVNTAGRKPFINTSGIAGIDKSDQPQKDDSYGGSVPTGSGSGVVIQSTASIETESPMADDFQIPDWVTQDYHAQAGFDAGDMDEKSRQIIESMLAEEEFYSGRPSKKLSSASNKQATSIGGSKAAAVSRPKANTGSHSREPTDPSCSRNGHKSTSKSTHDSKKRKSSAERSGQSKRTASEDARLNAISSVDLPSHNTRWTSEEDDRLREGIRLHGYGNWKAIAAVVATRNPLQVKNHARHLSVSDRVPHDVSTNTSDGEGLDKRSSAANSADEDMTDPTLFKKRHSRSKRVKRIDASRRSEADFDRYGGRARRARSITSESGNDDFTGSEFGATSGYDTDNDDDARSMTKSPSLSAKGGSRSGSIGLGTPSPGLRPLFSSSSLSSPYTLTSQRTGISSMDEDEDIDVDIESTDEDAANRMNLARSLRPYARKAKSRSISPFSNSSTRSRLSSEFDSQSDQDLEDDDMDEVVESGNVRKRVSAASPALSDTLGSSSDLYSNPTFNTSGSSINSIGAAGSFKPLLKDTQFHLQQQHQQHLQQLQKGGTLSHISVDKMVNSPKERRTVSFGAVHVAELQPDINSYDEDEMHSSEDNGSARKRGLAPLSETSSYLHGSTATALPTGLAPPVNLAGIDPTLTGSMVLPSSLRNGQGHRINAKRMHSNQESEEDNYDEEEGSLGTGQKKLAHPAGILSLSRKGQKNLSKSKSYSALSTQAQGGNSNNSASLLHYSHGQLSITPAMTMNSTAMVLPTTPPNVTPRILDKTIITEEETRVHSEFFCNKASKTPERYQRIRNTIIQAWEKSPSTYLTKTSVRSALKDCGDVNAIGRVHSWLESIGVINVGMTASSPGASLARPRNGGNNSSKKRGQSEDRGWSSSSSSSTPRRRSNPAVFNDLDDMDSVWVTPPLRRRRVRNERGEWVNESDLEGHVIEHNVHNTKDEKRSGSSRRSDRKSTDIFQLDDEAFFERYGMTKEEMEEELDQERLAAQNAKYFAASELHPVNNKVPRNLRAGHLIRQSNRSYFHGDEDDDGDMEAYIDEIGAGGSRSAGNQYDPFRLVPLRKYNAHNQAPFRVKVSSDAMLIMDFHSHLAETEVIGLLGGLYDEDEKILFILGVFPCRSISTGLQCEMDPESDVEARFFFSSKGFVVVGWYHSHPTFEPNPSIRDIENQSEHQTMFRRHELNVEPFVGVIVSPFDPRNLSFLSKFQFLSVSEQVDERLNCRLPFRYDREITRTNELSMSVFQQLSDLVRYYRTYEHRVDLSLPLRKGEATTTTRLDKLLKSISHHIFVDETNAKAFLSKVRELVIRGFQLNLPLHTTASSSTSSTDATASASAPTSTSSATLAGPPLRSTTPTGTTSTTQSTSQPTSATPIPINDGTTGGSSTGEIQSDPTTPVEVVIDDVNIDQTPSPPPLAQPPPP